ncbi:hypothetical protein [Brytella acorum]|uniref:Uncharacterized protein n=1 Tax=Brytella acorum TaxID=2959299 RepID=A0AA35UYP8_9PROT|nr:hypothetical protein [Brytella acorum]CAI9119562.1 hypothetical protein LMG32879_000379 [Brytella acorum]
MSASTLRKKALAERVEKQLAQKQATPLEIMARVMAGDVSVTEMQFEAAKAAAPYIHPKLSAVTMNATVKRSVTEYSDDELAAIAGEGEESSPD